MKHLAGPIAFVLSSVTSAALTFVATPVPDPPLPPPASLATESVPGPTVCSAPCGRIPKVRVTQLALDRDRNTLTATIRLAPGERPDRTTRFWAAFWLSKPGQDTGFETRFVAVDFSSGRDTVTVTADAPWVGSPGDSGSGYFATMAVSKAVNSTVFTMNDDLVSPHYIPVVVYGAR